MDSVLKRKASARRHKPDADGSGGVEKAFRLALARAAQSVSGLDLTISDLTIGHHSLAELLELLPERALIIMLEGPGEGLGLATLDQGALSALIEAITTGRLGASAPAPRRPTRTDAAMAAGLVDRTLGGLEAELAEAQDRAWARGFRYASFLEDPRPLELLLEDKPFRLFRARLGFANGREGALLAALPAQGHGRAARPNAPAAGEAAQAPASLADVAMSAPAELMAVLGRLNLPLARVMGLKPDDLLPVSAAALEAVALEGPGGLRIALGRLGQNHGNRAVRLSAPGEEGGSEAAWPTGASPAAAALDMAAPDLSGLGMGEPDFSGLDMAEPGLAPMPMAVPFDLPEGEAGGELGGEPGFAMGDFGAPFEAGEEGLEPLPMAAPLDLDAIPMAS